MKVAVITDTHAGVRGDSDHFADYQEKFYREVFFPVCKERGIDRIIHGGDYFDRRKFINFKSLERNAKMFLQPMVEADMHMDIIIGNHDVFYKNTNDVNSPELLFGSYMDNINLITDNTTIDIDGRLVHFIPWINNANYKKAVEFIENAEPSLVVGHFDITGCKMIPQGAVCDHGINREVFKKHPKVISGHYHTQSETGNIHYIGNPFEFTWGDCGDARGFWIIDLPTLEMEFIRNPFTIFETVTYNDGGDVPEIGGKFVKVLVENKSNPFEFDIWLEQLYNKNPIELQVVDLQQVAESELTEDEIREKSKSTDEIITTYVESLSVDDSLKKNTKTLIDNIYQLALNEL